MLRSSVRWAYAVLVCMTIGLGCADADREDTRAAEGRGAIDAGREPTTATDAGAAGPCAARSDGTGAPQAIADVVTLIDTLPQPLSLPCFVQALARPLAMQAVDSLFSAQPAEGTRSPRIFLFFPGLTLSVAPAGMGSHLLEMGEHRPNDESLKAELEFPISEQLDAASPFARVRYDDTISTCGFCHQGERREEAAPSPSAYVSPSFRPRASQRVPLTDLKAEADACDPSVEPERCALLHALFDQQPPPVDHEFPASYPFF
jgi:hypothetical protein